MPGPDLNVAGVGAIGRYFTVVSLVPSSVLSAYVVVLIRSGAWAGDEVHLDNIGRDTSVKDALIWSVGTVLLALALHPLQFSLIQLFEGYWGTSRLGRRLALTGIRRHRRLALHLRDLALDSGQAIKFDAGNLPAADGRKAPDTQIAAVWTSREAGRERGAYPPRLQDVMPTRLGNVLRRYEFAAGSFYKLNSITIVPRVLQVADPRDVGYVQNQRIQLELAIRMSALSLVATASTCAFMWRHEWYLLLALGPYAVAYLSYRGAVVIAHEYGTAIAVLLELNRFALYERLRLSLPSDIQSERELADKVVRSLSLENIGELGPLYNDDFKYAAPLPADPVT